MAETGDYNVLIVTSWHDAIDRLTEIGKQNFGNVIVVYWEVGNRSTKPAALQEIAETDYNLIVSYINGLVLERHHLSSGHTSGRSTSTRPLPSTLGSSAFCVSRSSAAPSEPTMG